jgi:tRNA U34 2-thiouridine synthase MnmA/TrmU
MFGFVTASVKELDQSQQNRYGGVYCGICRQIKNRATQTARLTLRYDMAFLALLLMSLYEPEEESAPLRCAAKARSRMNEQSCTLYPEADGRCRVVFDVPQRALTPGQAVVLYDGDTVLGGGTIREVL